MIPITEKQIGIIIGGAMAFMPLVITYAYSWSLRNPELAAEVIKKFLDVFIKPVELCNKFLDLFKKGNES